MTEPGARYVTSPIETDDAEHGFRSGRRPLDDYFARHAVANDREGIGRTYVLRRKAGDQPVLPRILGYYTLSMSLIEASDAAKVLSKKLPRYPMPVALIGRLAIDERAQARGLGEKLLMDALRRITDASEIFGCIGVIVDAKDEKAEHFYANYDFRTVHADKWPHRMFLPIEVMKAAFRDE